MKFGTDGIRGVAGIELTPEIALKLGYHSARLLSKGSRDASFVIGKDPRLSSDMLEAALCSGIMLAGANSVRLGVVTTPAVPFALRFNGYAGGFMITASHNPIQDNGIKVFGADGLKLPESLEIQLEKSIEAKLDYLGTPAPNYGRSSRDTLSRANYVKFLTDTLRKAGLNGNAKVSGKKLKVVFDCANGSTAELCKEVFSGFPGEFRFINAVFDGSKINHKCGATDLAVLKREVKRFGANYGVAFDGDGDRALLVDSSGKEVDGDKIMGLLAVNIAKYRKTKCVVATVMSNFGLEEFLASHGIRLDRVPVGDKYVLQGLLERGLLLGGEQSGHIVMLDRAQAGDGLLTAAVVTGVACSTGKSIEELTSGIKKYPQILTNIQVQTKSGWERDKKVADVLSRINEQLSAQGRLLIRPSGTEPLIRVMVESKSRSLAKSAVEEASLAIRDWSERQSRH